MVTVCNDSLIQVRSTVLSTIIQIILVKSFQTPSNSSPFNHHPSLVNSFLIQVILTSSKSSQPSIKSSPQSPSKSSPYCHHPSQVLSIIIQVMFLQLPSKSSPVSNHPSQVLSIIIQVKSFQP